MNGKRIISWTRRLVFFALLWIILSGDPGREPFIAGLGILAATLTSLALWTRNPINLRWRGLPALGAYFLWSSLKGGVDISSRALRPTMPLRTRLIEFQSNLTSESSLVIFAWMISLMPGTACVTLLNKSRLTVHVVDSETYDHASLLALETKIAACIQKRA